MRNDGWMKDAQSIWIRWNYQQKSSNLLSELCSKTLWKYHLELACISLYYQEIDRSGRINALGKIS